MVMMNGIEAPAAPVKFVDVSIMKRMMMIAAMMGEVVSTEAAVAAVHVHVTRV